MGELVNALWVIGAVLVLIWLAIVCCGIQYAITSHNDHYVERAIDELTEVVREMKDDGSR